jgi:hypothetical protein
MVDPKDNYIPDEDSSRRRPAMPDRPADEGDEDVLASIARQHASRLGLGQAVRQDSSRTDSVSPEPPAAGLVEPPVSSEVEKPLRKPIDLRSPYSEGVFHVRRALRKSQHESLLGESARRLIIHLAIVAALTGLAVALYFLIGD